MSTEKKTLILSTIAVLTLIVVIVGATYAYFQAQGGGTANTNVNVQSNTTDNLSFEVGSAINLVANESNFAEGMDNQAGSTTASATLTANNATNKATRNYYLYLDITNNEFTYTTVEETAELILTIENPDGTELQTLESYEYTTVGEVSGFDITEANGLITIADNYEITATDQPTTQEWNITVTFVNLDSDQNTNTNKTFNASLIIREEPISSNLAEACQTGENLTDCLKKLYISDGKNDLYYHDGVGTYTNASQEASDYSYRFSGADYHLTDLAYLEGYERISISDYADETQTKGIVDFYCNNVKQFVSVACATTRPAHYELAYDSERIQYASYEEALNQAVTDGYLVKDEVANFVCFGSDTTPCPIENLYRIIGVFNNQVKLIKYDYADSTILGEDGAFSGVTNNNFYSGKKNNATTTYRYFWNSNGTINDWSQSNLNTINLNTNYINYLGGNDSKWATSIASTNWQIGGNTYANIAEYNAKGIYTNEINNPSESINYSAKIGLMYISDYMYAMDPSGWTYLGFETTGLNDYRYIKDNNWIYMGDYDLTITPRKDPEERAYRISRTGTVGSGLTSEAFVVRPTFYLNTDVEYSSGTGTSTDPIILNFN